MSPVTENRIFWLFWAVVTPAAFAACVFSLLFP